MMIKKHDTNGTKSLLTEGEFGYDKQGLDRGRVYIGTNTGNTALAKKSEVDSKINSSLAGVSNGIATLGSDGKLTSSQMPTSVLGSLVYDGVWDASTNTPIIQLASALNSGHYYKVSISGFTNIDGISEWNVGDWIISNGVSWDKIDNTDSITSVNGMSGAVVLTKNDIGLGNLTNILDSQRCVLSATKLSTARNINGVPFDGTTDINIATVDAYTKTETNACLALKQNSLVSGTNIKTVNGISLLGSGDIVISGGSGGTWGTITGTLSMQTDLINCINTKQNTLVSGTSIKTINGNSLLGSGNIVVSSSESIATAIASAATTSISAAGANSVHITGTTTITSLGTGTTGQTVKVIFDGALILTHNDTSLMNISNANITTAAGDTAVFLNENGASGYWRMLSYTRKDGTALVAPTSVPIAKCLVNTVSTCVNAIIPVMATNSNGLTTCIATSEVNACAIKNLIMCATGSCSKVCMYTCLYSKSNLAQKMLNVTSNPGFNDCTLVSSESGNVYRDYYINATYGQNSRYVSRIVSSYGYVCMLSSVNSTNGVGNIINAFSCSSNSTMYLTTCVGGTTNNTKRAMTCIASLSSTAAATVVCIESCQVSGSGSGVSCIEMKSPTIKLIGLPTTNPGVSGALWNNNGVLNIVP